MSEIYVVAFLYPKEGKLERLRELLADMCPEVQSKEEGTLRYILTEQIGSKNPCLVVIETYKSHEANMKHASTDYFKKLFATVEKEGLGAKAPYIVRSVAKAGFDLDRKLISSKL